LIGQVVRAALDERFGPQGSPTTLSHLGDTVLQERSDVGDDTLAGFSGPAVLSAPLHTKFADEYHLNAHLTPVLTKLFEHNQLVLVNTERWQWLQVTDTPGRLDLKPDFIVCHKSFYSPKELATPSNDIALSHQTARDQGITLRFGILASWTLRDSVFVLEAKVKIDKEAVGKMVLYLTNICRGREAAIARGMLYDVDGFMLMSTNHASVQQLKRGRWTQEGSEAAIKEFFGNTDFPWVQALEAQCKEHKLSADECGFLGHGAMGRAFRLTAEQEGGGLVFRALKVVLRKNIDRLRAEFELNQRLKSACIVKADKFCAHDNWAGMLMALGEKLKMSRDVAKELVTLLSTLHQEGYAHGDPRLENAIRVDGHLKWIDLVDCTALPATLRYTTDIATLCKSSAEWLPFRPAQRDIEAYAAACCADPLNRATVKSAFSSILSCVFEGQQALNFS
jgi:hypothetical protein